MIIDVYKQISPINVELFAIYDDTNRQYLGADGEYYSYRQIQFNDKLMKLTDFNSLRWAISVFKRRHPKNRRIGHHNGGFRFEVKS